MRFFNTAGPVKPAKHYCIAPLDRLNLAEVLALVRDEKYFGLHAPRQTGKTSSLLALRDLLNAEDGYRCVYVNVEAGQAGREDTQRAMRAILGELALRARQALGDEFVEEIWFDLLQRSGPDGALRQVLSRWAEADSTPLVLLIDEIDALVGDTLVSVLRQLRAGYDLVSAERGSVRGARRARLPHSIDRGERRHHRRQRVQYQGAVPASGRLFAGGGAGAAGAAHRGDRPGFHRGGPGDGLDADQGAAVAGQRLGRRSLFCRRIPRGVAPSGCRRGHPRRAGTAHCEAGDAPGSVGRQAQGGTGAAGGRAAVERGGKRARCRRTT